MGTASRAPRWTDHVQGGVTYNVSHLWPTISDYTVVAEPPKNGKPGKAARKYRIQVSYSHHCFSTDVTARLPATAPDEELYADLSRRGHDIRWFCPHRWQLSKTLPTILAAITTRPCFEAGTQNYLTVELGSPASPCDYVVYFTTERWKAGDGTDHNGIEIAGVKLTVQSAYERTDKPHRSKQRVGFNVILRRTV